MKRGTVAAAANGNGAVTAEEYVVTLKGASPDTVLVAEHQKAIWVVSVPFPTDPEEDPDLLARRQAYVRMLETTVHGQLDMLDTTDGLTQYNLGIFPPEQFPKDLVDSFTQNTQNWFANKVIPSLTPLTSKSGNQLLSWPQIYSSDKEKENLEALVAYLSVHDEKFRDAIQAQLTKKVGELSARIGEKLRAKYPSDFKRLFDVALQNIPGAVESYILAEAAGLLAMRLRGYQRLFYQNTDLGAPMAYLANAEFSGSGLEKWSDLLAVINQPQHKLKVTLVSRYIPRTEFLEKKLKGGANGHAESVNGHPTTSAPIPAQQRRSPTLSDASLNGGSSPPLSLGAPAIMARNGNGGSATSFPLTTAYSATRQAVIDAGMQHFFESATISDDYKLRGFERLLKMGGAVSPDKTLAESGMMGDVKDKQPDLDEQPDSSARRKLFGSSSAN